jgi:hypothetical protein
MKALKPPNSTRRAAEASPQTDPLTTNEDLYGQPPKPLGFALGKFFIFTSFPAGFLDLFEGLFLYPPMIRVNLSLYGTHPGAGKAVIALVGENLLIILLGVLRFVSAHGLMLKKPYGYYITQAYLILASIFTIIFTILPLSTYSIIDSNGIQTGGFPTLDCFRILIFLSWILYFENRKHMFVPNS